MITSITIPSGRKGFNKGMEFDFSDKKLVVITGINGCGKTTLLSQLHREQQKINSNSVFFKTSNQNIYKDTSRYISLRRYRDDSDQDNLSVGGICEEIYKEFFDFCRIKKIYITSPVEVFNMMFNEESELYDKGYDFLPKVAEMLSRATSESVDLVRKKLGVAPEEEVTSETIKKLKTLFPSNHKEIVQDYKNNQRSTYSNYREREDSKSYKGDSEQVRQAEQSVKTQLAKSCRKKSNIKDKSGFEEYIYELINPLQSVEAVVEKLSKKIDDDFKKNKARRGYKRVWESINEELEKYNKDEFRYLLNSPTDHNSYKILFYSKDKSQKSEYIDFDSLSSGEKVIFELICYYFVCREDVSKNKKSELKLMIFDEFDANLNPSLAELYLKTIKEEFVKKGITIILTTHSPSTVAEVDPKELCELSVNNNIHKIEWAEDEDGKKKILEKLAPKFVYNDDLGFLGLANSKADVLIFTEGTTDEEFFQKYANKEKLSYKFIGCDSACNIRFASNTFSIIPYFKKLSERKIIICLFDFDQQGIAQIHECTKDKIGKKVSNFAHKKEPIIIKIDSKPIYFTALVPQENSDKWNSYEENKNYELEHVKEEGESGIKRQFETISKIIKLARNLS